MGIITLFFIALGLSMDAFAVSISNGICYKKIGIKEAVFTALTFGFFQAVMPLVGYFAGTQVSGLITSIDHWVALILLSFIGGTMIFGAIKDLRYPEACAINQRFTAKGLLMQGVATSIDALAVGVSLAVIRTNIWTAVSFIGMTTFVCSFAGVYIGKTFGCLLKEKAEIFGGCLLIVIGLKIFIEHTF